MSDDRFFSMDKLVEFGMSMAVAQQMVQTMNHAMNHMQVQSPHLNTGPQLPSYYVTIDQKPIGPLNEQEMVQLVRENKVGRNTFVWKQGLAGWVLAEQLPEVLKWIMLTPPPVPPAQTS